MLKLPARFEDHPINANNRKILRDFVLAFGNGSMEEELIEKRVNALYDFLLDHTNTKDFDNRVHLGYDDERLSYEQYAEKRFYHDGSQEYRMILYFYPISKEIYEEFEKTGSEKNYDSCAVHPKWFNECSGSYFNKYKYTYQWLGATRIGEEYCFFAKDFLSCFDYIRICCYLWE